MMKSDFYTSFYKPFIWRSKLKWQLKVFFLCFCDCYVPSASQVTRMVLWSPHCARPWYWGGVVWTNSRHHPLCDTGGRHRVWSVPRGGQEPPGRLQPGQMVSSPVNRSAQTHNLIMGSRHTSKGFSSVQCFLTFVNSYLKFFWFWCKKLLLHLVFRQGCDLVLQQRNHETKAT